MSSPLVTVITTSYNRAAMLPATIESVLRQTFTDFEYLIVDDRSPDASVAVARRYETDPRVRVLLNQKNLGDYGNRNQAARVARGKYLKYVDCDDVAYPHCLETMVQHLDQFPEAAMAFSTSGRAPWVYPVQLSPADAYRVYFQEGRLFSQATLDTMIRREALLAAGGFPEIYTGDTACWLRLARSWPVVLTVPGLIWWRVHEGQLSQEMRERSPRRAALEAETIKLLLEALDNPACPLPDAERMFYRRRVVRDFAAIWMRHALRQEWACCRELRRGVSKMCITDVAEAFRPHVHKPKLPEPRGVSLLCSSKRSTVSFQDSPLPVSDSKVSGPVSTVDLRPSTFTPLVSVLIPAHNAESHLAEAIECVLAQRFTDWELIIVDDVSTDRTAEIAQSYADGNRIRYFRNERNLGKWPNHNRCAELARGKHLKFLHADDYLYPLCLQAMLQHVTSDVREGPLVLSAPSPLPAGTRLSYGEALRHELFLSPILVHSPSAFLVGAEAFRALGGFQPGVAFCERHLQIRAAQRGSVVLANEGLVFFRRLHRWGIGCDEKYPMGLCEGMVWLERLLLDEASPLSEMEKDYVRFRLRYGIAQRAWKLLRTGRVALLRDALKTNGIRLKDLLRGLGKIPTEHAAIGEALVQTKTATMID